MTKESILQDVLQLSSNTYDYQYVERMLPSITNINVAKINESKVGITLYHHYDEMYVLERDIVISYDEFYTQVVEGFDW